MQGLVKSSSDKKETDKLRKELSMSHNEIEKLEKQLKKGKEACCCKDKDDDEDDKKKSKKRRRKERIKVVTAHLSKLRCPQGAMTQNQINESTPR